MTAVVPDPATVIDLTVGDGVDALKRRYPTTRPQVLEAVFGHALWSLHATTAIIEHHYIDADYRDEYSRFYSRNFRRHPATVDRIHFFRGPRIVPDAGGFRLPDISGHRYLGFTVIRPLPGAPVGRTLLAAGDELEDHAACVADAEVNFFGTELTVTTMPFMAQDAQFGVCAHVASWSVAYYHHLRHRAPRFLPGDVVGAAPAEAGMARPTLASGLQPREMSGLLRRLGLPAVPYVRARLHASRSFEEILRTYVRSGLPVAAGTSEHVCVVLGYRSVRRGRSLLTEFVVHDDESGPYQLVSTADRMFNSWTDLVVPLPDRLYVTADVAASISDTWLRHLVKTAARADDRREGNAEAGELERNIRRGQLEVRVTATPSNRFKAGLEARGFPPEFADPYRLMSMPRWIWVGELTDRGALAAAKPSVHAEVIIDPTIHPRDQSVLCWRVPGELGWSYLHDRPGVQTIALPNPAVLPVAGLIDHLPL